MGFTHDPGPLPFATIRSQKWANRTWVDELIEIHGEHGCTMPSTAARVVSIEPFRGECPAHLASVYKGERLYSIELAPAPGWEKVGETWLFVRGNGDLD